MCSSQFRCIDMKGSPSNLYSFFKSNILTQRFLKKCNAKAGSMTIAVPLAVFAPCSPIEALPIKLGVFGRVRENSNSREYPSTVTIPVVCCCISSLARFIRISNCQSNVLLDYSYHRNLMSFSCADA